MTVALLVLTVALANPHTDVDPSRYEAALEDADAPAWEKRAARAAFLESQARPADALPLWVEVAADPDAGVRRLHARERVAFLEARRDDDGSLDGWTRLQTARLEFEASGSEIARQRIVALLTAEGLASLTSAEARLWLARDALLRRKDPQAAHDLAKPLWEARDRWPDWVRTRAGITYTKALARLGRWDEALAIQEGFQVDATGAPRPTAVDEVRRDLELTHRRKVAWGTVGGAGLLLVATLLARLRERPPIPWGLVPLSLALLVAWGIAEGWESGAGAAVPDFAAGALTLHLLAATSLHATGSAAWRNLLRVASVAATLAVAWLALDTHQQLGWMGW